MATQKDETDWAAVRAWYDDGHTRDECCERFGFSKRAWGKAVAAGKIMPRPPGTQVGTDSTRRAVEELLTASLRYVDVARHLGIAKSTVAFHARRIGLEADRRFRRRYDWDQVQRAHDAGMRARECCRHFGFTGATWTAAVRRGDIVARSHLIPIEDLLVAGRRTSRGHLKARLIREGLKQTAARSAASRRGGVNR
jgi:hypothetical protein